MRLVIDGVTRLVRRYRLDGNPLRRRTDRWESAGLAVAMLLILLALWPATAAARQAYEGAQAAGADRRQVRATLLADTPVTALSFGEVGGGGMVAAGWTAPSGRRHTGKVSVLSPAKAGSQLTIWIDGAGRPAPPPPSEAELRITAAATALMILGVAACLVLCTFAIFRHALDRVRLREWAVAWSLADDHWRHRPS
ncbi:hypothetical protein ACFMQL_32085 [Nonomuraea fastidiosa]|jgi:hypothetical protein|uniref:Rv1733c family protein n=1 Tax=Nonomuraea TaxID=83681 RepID=UPI0032501967